MRSELCPLHPGNCFELLRNSRRFSLWASTDTYCSKQALDSLASGDYARIFESCFITKLENEESRIEATTLLFSELAGDAYNSVIDAGRNLDCYNLLYDEAKKEAKIDFNSILDFGCGPGTVLASDVYNQTKSLAGYDLVEQNRKHANALGLHTLSSEDIDNLAEESLDFIVCSYVLHYMSIKRCTITKLIASLREGGVLAANFHKCTGINWFLNCVDSIAAIRVTRKPSHFGDLVLITKGDSHAKN